MALFEDPFKFSRHLKEKSVLANGRQLCDIIHTQAAMTGDSSISRCGAVLIVPAHNLTIPVHCKQVNVARILVFQDRKHDLKQVLKWEIKIVCQWGPYFPSNSITSPNFLKPGNIMEPPVKRRRLATKDCPECTICSVNVFEVNCLVLISDYCSSQ